MKDLDDIDGPDPRRIRDSGPENREHVTDVYVCPVHCDVMGNQVIATNDVEISIESFN
jgi:hypothetical protein